MSVIKTGTTSTTGYIVESDTNGNLVIQTGSTPTTALTLNSDQTATFAQSVNIPNTFGFKNRIINGGMVIDQRNAGVAITGGGFALDRFQTVLTAITSLVVASQQVTDAPSNSGFNYSYKYTVTTAATAYSTGGRTGILHRIEGYNSADFMFGTVNAKSVTFSFWVKSSVTGTYSVGFLNDDSSRAYPATYTVNSANTWEYKTITIAGCPDGTWLTTNGRGIQVEFCLGADTSRLGTANTWNSAFVVGATGTTLLSNTVGATFQVTGVQLEKGSTATSFDFRPYGTELMLCQKYLPAWNWVSGNDSVGFGYSVSTVSSLINVAIPVTPRVAPTGVSTSAMTNFILRNGSNTGGTPTAIAINVTSSGVNQSLSVTTSAGAPTLIAGQGAFLFANGAAQILFTGCEL
jgi:hypothetical protein